MQMWGLKLQAGLESGKALAAKLVIAREMLSQAHMCMHARKCAQRESLFFIIVGLQQDVNKSSHLTSSV